MITTVVYTPLQVPARQYQCVYYRCCLMLHLLGMVRFDRLRNTQRLFIQIYTVFGIA